MSPKNISNLKLLAKIKLLEMSNKRLLHRVDSLEDRLERERRVIRTLKRSERDVSIERYAGYFKYKYNLLKSTDVWSTAERIFAYSRRSLLAARLIRYGALAIAVIETSAVFLLFTSVLAIVVPVTLIAGLLICFAVMITGNERNKRLLPLLQGKRIIFIFAPDGYKDKNHRYLQRMTQELAQNEEYFVLVISSALRDGFYLTAHMERPRIAIIREAYFFKLRRAMRAYGINDSQVIMVH